MHLGNHWLCFNALCNGMRWRSHLSFLYLCPTMVHILCTSYISTYIMCGRTWHKVASVWPATYCTKKILLKWRVGFLSNYNENKTVPWFFYNHIDIAKQLITQCIKNHGISCYRDSITLYLTASFFFESGTMPIPTKSQKPTNFSKTKLHQTWIFNVSIHLFFLHSHYDWINDCDKKETSLWK